MKIRILFLFIFISLLGTMGCNNADRTAVVTQNLPTTFFDIEQYFDAEIKRLQAQNIGVTKQIKSPTNKEEKTIAAIDWKEELALFPQSAINKPTWSDKYQVDSTIEGQMLHVEYRALDQSLKTQKIDIDWHKDEIKMILIVNNSNNQIYEGQEILKYTPDQGYSMHKTQDVILLEASDYTIDASFQK